jgi:hypothetical protein
VISATGFLTIPQVKKRPGTSAILILALILRGWILFGIPDRLMEQFQCVVHAPRVQELRAIIIMRIAGAIPPTLAH